MKILLINKFLYPKGGSESYLFGLGSVLEKQGHKVQYFGMDHPERICGNAVESYTSSMDFHEDSIWDKITYPLKTIYSAEARKKIKAVLDDFCPDICHINNFNYQLTPSIILEIDKWRKNKNTPCKIIYTAHDLQLVCPNHLMFNPVTKGICEKCSDRNFFECFKNKCIHGSYVKSLIGSAEAYIWNHTDVYNKIDVVISPSHFLASKLSRNSHIREKITVMHNFIDVIPHSSEIKSDYVLYYGRYSKEKGISTLLDVVDSLPDIKFVFAGSGEFSEEIEKRTNAVNLGFLSGESLINVISKARFTVVPSECYENCPYTVMESQVYGTPVLGSDIGGIPELIKDGKTGKLFACGNRTDIINAVSELYYNPDKLIEYTENCKNVLFDTPESYYEKLIKLYS